MKKTLVALAVIAASGAAMAQSSVTLYGVADMVIHKDKGQSTALTSGGVSTSRWGIKGTEDLGGGLKAGFVFEQGFNLDNGSLRGNGFDRQALLSISGGFGEVKLGKTWNAYDDIAGASDAVFNANVLSPMNLVFRSWYNYGGNPNNGIYYATPEFGGFSGAVSLSLDEKNAGTDETAAFHVKYASGPVFVALGYQDSKTFGLKYTTVNGSYDFGAAKLLLTYAKVNAAGADTSEYAIGADIPLGGNLVASVGYGSSKTDGFKRANSFSAAVAYALSKRTTVYAGFADANQAALDTGAVVGNGAVDSRFGVGLKHTF